MKRKNRTLYVVKWALARGIVKVNATLYRQDGVQGAMKDWYRVALPYRDRSRMNVVSIGKDAFLTLERAQAAVRRMFNEALADAEKSVERLRSGLTLAESGEVNVHDLTGSHDLRMKDLHAFNEDLGGT